MTAYINKSSKPTIALGTQCESCIQVAQVRVTMHSGTQLYFCGHHYRNHEEALEDQALAIEDERHLVGAYIPHQKAVSTQ